MTSPHTPPSLPHPPPRPPQVVPTSLDGLPQLGRNRSLGEERGIKMIAWAASLATPLGRITYYQAKTGFLPSVKLVGLLFHYFSSHVGPKVGWIKNPRWFFFSSGVWRDSEFLYFTPHTVYFISSSNIKEAGLVKFFF